MRLGIGGILLVVAIIVFIAQAVGLKVSNIELLPIGLAFLGAGLLLDGRR